VQAVALPVGSAADGRFPLTAGDRDEIFQWAPIVAVPRHRVTLARMSAAGALATQFPFVSEIKGIMFLHVELEGGVLGVWRRESGLRFWVGIGGN
jgi:hypothetical protein